jgi:hypothetical protein
LDHRSCGLDNLASFLLDASNKLFKLALFGTQRSCFNFAKRNFLLKTCASCYCLWLGLLLITRCIFSSQSRLPHRRLNSRVADYDTLHPLTVNRFFCTRKTKKRERTSSEGASWSGKLYWCPPKRLHELDSLARAFISMSLVVKLIHPCPSILKLRALRNFGTAAPQCRILHKMDFRNLLCMFPLRTF